MFWVNEHFYSDIGNCCYTEPTSTIAEETSEEPIEVKKPASGHLSFPTVTAASTLEERFVKILCSVAKAINFPLNLCVAFFITFTQRLNPAYFCPSILL